MAVCEEDGAHNVCFTGGEPFMQPDGELHELAKILNGHGYDMEVFTNGSYRFRSWVHGLQVMMDWKLAGSGESMNHRAERTWNAGELKTTDGIKFVVKTVNDLDEAMRVAEVLKTKAQYWVGAAWGHIRDDFIVDYIKHYKLPWRLNVQTHKYVWEPTQRGV
jgi:7-carboxy-7-deazaguanine synthase